MNKDKLLQVLYYFISFLIPLVMAFVLTFVMGLFSFFSTMSGASFSQFLVLIILFPLTFKLIRNIGSKFFNLVKNKYTFFVPLFLLLFYFLLRFVYELVFATNRYGDLLQVNGGFPYFLLSSRELFRILNIYLPFILVLLAYAYGGYSRMKKGLKKEK